MKQKNKKIGMFIGKFLPPHKGHITQILKCADECDKLFVIVADSKQRSKKLCKASGINVIYPKTRYFWMKNYFKNNKKITVKFLNQGMLEAYPKNIDNWKKKLLKVTNHRARIWFIDKNFLSQSKEVFPELEFIGFDRSNINISSKEIRNNPEIYKNLVFKDLYKIIN